MRPDLIEVAKDCDQCGKPLKLRIPMAMYLDSLEKGSLSLCQPCHEASRYVAELERKEMGYVYPAR